MPELLGTVGKEDAVEVIVLVLKDLRQKAAGTALEVNSNPHRLDLWGSAVKAAIDAGATIAIDTDAHSPPEYANVRYGVHTARRGWAEAADVLNARYADGVREFLH